MHYKCGLCIFNLLYLIGETNHKKKSLKLRTFKICITFVMYDVLIYKMVLCKKKNA
jgi:hypothetical protein